jgi:methionyl-tRNA formyltransferase
MNEMNKNPRFAFFGTPTFATLVLDELINAGHTPALIVTTPDMPAGRGLNIISSPIKNYAVDRHIPFAQPTKFDEDFIAELKKKNIELVIVAAFGKILPSALLSFGMYPPLNVHPSLLPAYRGTSPVESQILADEKNIGVSIIHMDEKMDHGPIVAKKLVPIINWPISRDSLNTILWREGGRLLSEILPEWIKGKIKETPQDETEATYTKKIKKDDGLLDLSQPGRKNFLKYLAYEGWPGTYFFQEKNGKRIRVIIKDAELKDGEFIIKRVVPEGKKEMGYGEFLKTL